MRKCIAMGCGNERKDAFVFCADHETDHSICYVSLSAMKALIDAARDCAATRALSEALKAFDGEEALK